MSTSSDSKKDNFGSVEPAYGTIESFASTGCLKSLRDLIKFSYNCVSLSGVGYNSWSAKIDS